MYNLHCHSLLSDGALLPSEVAVRYLYLGYKTIAITDHADYSNIESTVESILEFTKHWPKTQSINILPGIELTHLPPEQFGPLTKYAKKKGIKVIIGHGETIAEPVIKGTNRAALKAGVDILAHPGLIRDEDVRIAKEKNIFLEITSRKGHADTNAHVAERALKLGAKLILNTDSHEPEDIITTQDLSDAAYKSGLNLKEINKIYRDTGEFIKKKGGQMKKSYSALAFLLFCFFILGCAVLPKREQPISKTSNLLEPSGAVKFSDIPVPAGFKLIPQSSYSFESSGVRVGVLKYQGRADIEQVINFFKEQMPMYSWNLLNIVEYGERLMNYERENETCIINLLPKGKNITITMSLGPRPQIYRKDKATIK